MRSAMTFYKCELTKFKQINFDMQRAQVNRDVNIILGHRSWPRYR